MNAANQTRVVFFVLSLVSLLPEYLTAQSKLSQRQVAQGEALGRTTDHSLTFGTFASLKEENFNAFVLSPIQRIAYITSEEASTHHRDILKDEISLNRMRVSITSFDLHRPRLVTLLSQDQSRTLQPAHLVFEMNGMLADAEFEMPDVTKLGSPKGQISIEVTDENGKKHRPIPFALRQLTKPVLSGTR